MYPLRIRIRAWRKRRRARAEKQFGESGEAEKMRGRATTGAAEVGLSIEHTRTAHCVGGGEVVKELSAPHLPPPSAKGGASALEKIRKGRRGQQRTSPKAKSGARALRGTLFWPTTL